MSSELDSSEDSILKYINTMLMEEEEDQPFTFQDQNLVNGFKVCDPLSDTHHQSGSLPNDPVPSDFVQSFFTCSDLDTPEDVLLNYVSQMLMEEEDLVHKPCMYQDCLALQAAEKSFYDVLGQKYPPLPDNQLILSVLDQSAESPNPSHTRPCISNSSNSFTAVDNLIESDWFHDGDKLESLLKKSSHVERSVDSILQSFGSSNSSSEALDTPEDSLVTSVQVPDLHSQKQFVSEFKRGESKLTQFPQFTDHRKLDLEPDEKNFKVVVEVENNGRECSLNGSRGKKNHLQEDMNYVEGGRRNKQLAVFSHEEFKEESELYDEVLLEPGLSHCLQEESAWCSDNDALHYEARKQIVRSKGSNRGRPRGNKVGKRKEVVDLITLLTHCAQAMTSGDSRTTNDMLKQIRQHSSPDGEGNERLAYFFANALEARLAGAGTAPYTAYAPAGISAADLLKAYRLHFKACPFRLLSNFFSNRSIYKLSSKASKLHIIDFGILYGFQWPCLIQRLSARHGGPPKLRITGIELPQPGFRPAERVEETGCRLVKYCKRFNVPFEYKAIAKKWDTIQLEELKIEKDELLVVNCLYRLKNVPDDTVVGTSPRDNVLNLIKRINPDLFIHGVVNGTHNAPFFATRFREALFHFSSMFDMFEAAAPREDQVRMLFEKEVIGRDVTNVIACEGTQRVERPESYKQWQTRNVRAGFRQLPLDREIVEDVKYMVWRGYNKDFVVDEDSNWLLQGWKGRILHALSYWKPAKEFRPTS